MKLIVGLGNPGLEYVNTRHNIGFVILEKFMDTKGLKLDKEKFDGIYTIDGVGEDRVIYLEPMTFMNLSGDSVRQIADFYKIDTSDILVVYDDKDIKLGDLRVKKQGSSAGHNGIKSIINQLGTDEFNRLRIGIGSNPKMQTSDYVLGKFTAQEKEVLDKNLDRYLSEIEKFINK